MWRSTLRFALPLMMILVMAAAPSCILDPEEKVEPPPPPEPYPARETREDCVTFLLRTYEDHDGTAGIKYEELLHPDYRFYLQPADVPPGESPFLTRSEDIDGTQNFLFDNPAELSLTLDGSGWDSYPEIEGEPCIDCWSSTRKYNIRYQRELEGTILIGDDSVVIIVAPDPSAEGKYVIRAIYDIDEI